MSNQQFTDLDKLHTRTNRWKIRVRVTRMWKPINSKKNCAISIEFVMLDSKGYQIHAVLFEKDFQYFDSVVKEDFVQEGSIYTLEKFDVVFAKDYRSVDNAYKIHFKEGTLVKIATEEANDISKHILELPITLWEGMTSIIPEDTMKQPNVVIIATSLKAGYYRGKLWASTLSGTKIYINMDIKDVKDFKQSLDGLAPGQAHTNNKKPLCTISHGRATTVTVIRRITSLHPCQTNFAPNASVTGVQDWEFQLKPPEKKPLPKKTAVRTHQQKNPAGELIDVHNGKSWPKLRYLVVKAKSAEKSWASGSALPQHANSNLNLPTNPQRDPRQPHDTSPILKTFPLEAHKVYEESLHPVGDNCVFAVHIEKMPPELDSHHTPIITDLVGQTAFVQALESIPTLRIQEAVQYLHSTILDHAIKR
ncbi:hypothetical protein IFM89_032963 [Coptis chinensis]|uniref:Replication protein A 70 kDa DNA-binding subunit B/D first OB fold domain-containing protein n=1 Tax=Coptis chinensis TaxID=261450 RepID=A0A835HLD1_9MAGN|nr:hypothetical protein IFM89_032963 [Coptis chinensis]